MALAMICLLLIPLDGPSRESLLGNGNDAGVLEANSNATGAGGGAKFEVEDDGVIVGVLVAKSTK